LEAPFIFVVVEQIVVADADVEEIAGSDAGRVVVVVLGAWAGREIRSSHIRTSMWSAERPASAAGFRRKDRPGVAVPSEAVRSTKPVESATGTAPATKPLS